MSNHYLWVPLFETPDFLGKDIIINHPSQSTLWEVNDKTVVISYVGIILIFKLYLKGSIYPGILIVAVFVKDWYAIRLKWLAWQ